MIGHEVFGQLLEMDDTDDDGPLYEFSRNINRTNFQQTRREWIRIDDALCVLLTCPQ